MVISSFGLGAASYFLLYQGSPVSGDTHVGRGTKKILQSVWLWLNCRHEFFKGRP
jgi:hypothetical protein